MQQLKRARNVFLGVIATLAMSAAAAFAQSPGQTTSAPPGQPSSQPPAGAQQPPPAPPPGYAAPKATVRKGLVFGFGIGGGSIRCDAPNCGGAMAAGSIDGHIGGMLRPRLALLADVWVMAHTENQLTLTQTIATAAVQFWLFPRLWVKGGVGVAHASFDYSGVVKVNGTSKSVLGIMGAIGYELIAGKSFVLDVALKGGTGFYSDQNAQAHNVALVAGFNWY